MKAAMKLKNERDKGPIESSGRGVSFGSLLQAMDESFERRPSQ